MRLDRRGGQPNGVAVCGPGQDDVHELHACVSLRQSCDLPAQALIANRSDAHAMFDDVRDAAGLRQGLAVTGPQQYGASASSTVEAMIGPITAAYVRLGHPPEQARAAATLLVSGPCGLGQDHLVTRDVARTDAAADRLIDGATAASG